MPCVAHLADEQCAGGGGDWKVYAWIRVGPKISLIGDQTAEYQTRVGKGLNLRRSKSNSRVGPDVCQIKIGANYFWWGGVWFSY